MQFGTYQPGSTQEKTELFSIGSGDSQTVSPTPEPAPRLHIVTDGESETRLA